MRVRSIVYLALAMVAAGYAVVASVDEGGQHFVLRSSAALSFAVFVFAFGALPRIRCARWRLLGVTHAFHLGAIAGFVSGSSRVSVTPATVVVGGLAYAGLALVVLSCPERWLRAIAWFLWFVFLGTFAGNAADRPLTSGVAALVAVAVGVVVGVRQRPRRPVATR